MVSSLTRGTCRCPSVCSCSRKRKLISCRCFRFRKLCGSCVSFVWRPVMKSCVFCLHFAVGCSVNENSKENVAASSHSPSPPPPSLRKSYLKCFQCETSQVWGISFAINIAFPLVICNIMQLVWHKFMLRVKWWIALTFRTKQNAQISALNYPGEQFCSSKCLVEF